MLFFFAVEWNVLRTVGSMPQDFLCLLRLFLDKLDWKSHKKSQWPISKNVKFLFSIQYSFCEVLLIFHQKCYFISKRGQTEVPITNGVLRSAVGRMSTDFIFHRFFFYWSLTLMGVSWLWSYGSWIFNYLYDQCLPPLKLWVVLEITLCDKVGQWLMTGRWFSDGTPVSSPNKTYHHDIINWIIWANSSQKDNYHKLNLYYRNQ